MTESTFFRRFLQRLVLLPRRIKQLLLLFADATIVPIALFASFAIRLGTLTPVVPRMWLLIGLAPVFILPAFWQLGLYRIILRYADNRLILRTFLANGFGFLALALSIFMMGISGVPRSSLIIFLLLSSILTLSCRFLVRRLIAGVDPQRPERPRRRLAIYGAGKAGIQLAMALKSSPEFRVMAFIDDDRELRGTNAFGLRIFGPDEIEKIITRYEIEGVVLAIPSVDRSTRQQVITNLEPYGLKLKTLPGIAELVTDRVRIEDIREVGIEDILGRDPVPPVKDLLAKNIEHKTVLVTGGGGSIGSELCRQILKLKPRCLIIVEASEIALYRILQELEANTEVLKPALSEGSAAHSKGPEALPRIRGVLADAKDKISLRRLFEEEKIDTVFHAAAHKHVPLVEDNMAVGVENNVFSTLNCAELALEFKAEKFILISTDKAVRPTNAMGASKRMAELILQAFAAAPEASTSFSMVRFGNVLGSSGSVVPLFKDQIQKGGPLTITHSEVTRYFMTVNEAVQLVIQAGALGGTGQVFVLDMGEPVKIIDLAKKMIRLSGLSIKDEEHPKGDIEIKIVGMRPGEKLFEELIIGPNSATTVHPRILTASEHFLDLTTLRRALSELGSACSLRDDQAVKEVLSKWVTEYQPRSI